MFITLRGAYQNILINIIFFFFFKTLQCLLRLGYVLVNREIEVKFSAIASAPQLLSRFEVLSKSPTQRVLKYGPVVRQITE
jgi:hypothetical protein